MVCYDMFLFCNHNNLILKLHHKNEELFSKRSKKLLQEADHVKNAVVLIFPHIHCLHFLYFEVAWVIVSSGTQVQLQIILDPDYLPDYLSVSYEYG